MSELPTMVYEIRYTPTVTLGAHETFTAVCEELGVAASGETERLARNGLEMVVVSFCRALLRRDLLDKAIEESGLVCQRRIESRDSQIDVIELVDHPAPDANRLTNHARRQR